MQQPMFPGLTGILCLELSSLDREVLRESLLQRLSYCDSTGTCSVYPSLTFIFCSYSQKIEDKLKMNTIYIYRYINNINKAIITLFL